MKGLLSSRKFQAGASIVLALGLFAFFLSRVPLTDIARQIAAASPAWLAATVLISLSTFLLRTVRWTWILRPLGRVPFFPAFRATAIGFAANTVLPARAGEILRPAILAREQGLPFPALLASIVFERVLDAMSQLFFLGIALALGPAGGAMGTFASGRIRWVVAAIAAVAIGVALFAVLWRAATERFLERVFLLLPGALPRRRAPHRAHVPRRLRLPEDAAPRARSSARLALHVARDQRPDLVRHARLRPRPAADGGLRRDDAPPSSGSRSRRPAASADTTRPSSSP